MVVMNLGSHYLSLSIAVLLVVYALFLIYALVTHKKEFSSEEMESIEENAASWSVGKALLVLCLSTVMVASVSEILIGTIEPSMLSPEQD